MNNSIKRIKSVLVRPQFNFTVEACANATQYSVFGQQI